MSNAAGLSDTAGISATPGMGALQRDEIIAAGEPWIGIVERGQVLRIVDLEGNQAVDTLFSTRTTPGSATAPPIRFARRATSI